jgi:hypothetical protein
MPTSTHTQTLPSRSVTSYLAAVMRCSSVGLPPSRFRVATGEANTNGSTQRSSGSRDSRRPAATAIVIPMTTYRVGTASRTS